MGMEEVSRILSTYIVLLLNVLGEWKKGEIVKNAQQLKMMMKNPKTVPAEINVKLCCCVMWYSPLLLKGGER